ncbi:MAG: serine dehydratase beta chain, partial [Woeseiaceae bacterium]
MAAISVFDIFKIGIGPSSSHTVGPMKAARAFRENLGDKNFSSVRVTLFGSLAWTGRGHGTDRAVLLGLDGHAPESIDPDAIDGILGRIRARGNVDVEFNYDHELDRHTNGMRFVAFGEDDEVVLQEEWYSLGGGFIARGDEPEPASRAGKPRIEFKTSESLLKAAADNDMSIADVVLCNETAWQSSEDVYAGLDGTWAAMNECIERGLRAEGVLPGKMAVMRRAPKLARSLAQQE